MVEIVREDNTFRFDTLSESLKHFSVTVAADSFNGENRVTTIIARYPRIILSEVNTHRVFSRNSASSRARSVKRTIADVMREPFIPLFTRNKAGMSGSMIEDNSDLMEARDIWLQARNEAVRSVFLLLFGESKNLPSAAAMPIVWEELVREYDDSDKSILLNIHKQSFNRLLEPFSWHESVITSSYWDNFLHLRLASDAQPEIQAFAQLLDAALRDCVPVSRDTHFPFLHDDFTVTHENLRELVLLSSSKAAKVSYNSVDETEKGVSIALGERLLSSEHMSPFEHCAISESLAKRLGVWSEYPTNLHSSWLQGRRIINPRPSL